MKQEYKQKLLKVSKIMGDGESPDLFYNRREFLKREKINRPSTLFEKEPDVVLGQCAPWANAIYINPSDKLPDGIKRDYSHYLYTLLHETVHFYFGFPHGFGFEKIIGALFKKIPEDEIPIVSELGDNETTYILCHECECLICLGWGPNGKGKRGDGVYVFHEDDEEHMCNTCAKHNMTPEG